MMDDPLDMAARRLLIRFGSRAAEIAWHRALDLAGKGEWRAQDEALLTLNRIEALSGTGAWRP